MVVPYLPHTNHLGPGIYRAATAVVVCRFPRSGLVLAPLAPGWPQALIQDQDMGKVWDWIWEEMGRGWMVKWGEVGLVQGDEFKIEVQPWVGSWV